MIKKIKCHQYLGGRFHEGYGRAEISKAEAEGRLKQTIDYETMNLEGRNTFIQDQYCAYEVVPTHVDWKNPGVFCVTNNTENGSQAARTYGIIPESGQVTDAFNLLLNKPQLSLEDFSAYDFGGKQLTWIEAECEDVELSSHYKLTEKAKQKLGQFIAAFWEAMSIRMNDPDTEERLPLCIKVIQTDGESVDPFRHLVDFFACEIVSRFPKAVQPMTSVSFGVPWTKRNAHKGVVCYVQSDDKELRMNQVFSFTLNASTKEVDISDNTHAAEDSMQEVAAVLLQGREAYPEVYRRLEDHFGDHPIVKSFDVFDLLVDAEQWKRNLMSLDRNSRAGKVRKFISENKKQYYDSLYYTLIKNCKCSAEDAFHILFPMLQNILEVMGDIEPGTEFQSGFDKDDIPFFAACRKQLAQSGDYAEEIAGKLDQMLIRSFESWGEQNFNSSFLKKQIEDQGAFPQETFRYIAEEALKSGNVKSKEVVDKIREYIRQNYKLNYSSEQDREFISILMNYEDSSKVADETIVSWEKWLTDCSETDIRKDIGPYATILLQWLEKSGQSDLGDRKIAGLRESLSNKNEIDPEVVKRADRLLTEHYCTWSKTGFTVDPGDRPIGKAAFYPIALGWLKRICNDPEAKPDRQNEEAIDAIQQYCRDYPQENDVCQIAEEIFQYLCRTREITKDLYDLQREWLQDGCRVNEKRAFVLLLILADKMFAENESMGKAGVDTVGDHMDDLARYNKDRKYETTVDTDALMKRETEFLLSNFAQWRQIENEKDFRSNLDTDILRDMAEQWQKDGLYESNLGYIELQSIYDSLISVRSKEGKKLDLSVLEKHMIRIQLREAVAKANKEKNYTSKDLQEIAAIRQRYIKSGHDEDDEDLASADRILIQNFYSWSEAGFQAGEDEPDSSFVDLTRVWIDSINPSKTPFKELDEIAEKLSEIPCIIKAKDKTLLEDLRKKSFDSMKAQSKDADLIDKDEEWLDRLMTYYSDEDTEEASDQRRDICKKLSEAYKRGKEKTDSPIFEKAKKYIILVLEKNQYLIPEEARREEAWIEVRRGQINGALEQMLARFPAIRELSEEKLETVWNEDYAGEYSVKWSELHAPNQSDFDAVISGYLDRIYSEAAEEDKVGILKDLWEMSSESGRNTKGIAGAERKFTTGRLDSDYNTIWINSGTNVRKELDALYDQMSQQNEMMDTAKRSEARKASQFSEAYIRETLKEEETKLLLRQVTEFPGWMKYLHVNELNDQDSAIGRANSSHDLSPQGIGMRLIHDLIMNQSDDRSYWDSVFQSLTPGNLPMNQLRKMNPWTAENSRILNAISYLSNALSELGDGGEKAAADLKKRLSSEAPDFLSKLCDGQLATKLWPEWDKLIPENKIYKLLTKSID